MEGSQQDLSCNLKVCQLCEKPSHTAIGCPWMYSNCKMPGCKGLMMLLRSERSMTKGIKYLKCQFPECEGFQWLHEAMTQAHASVGSSSLSSRMCYYCREYDHRHKQCQWNGCPCTRFVCNGSIHPCTRFVCNGSRYVHESQREWSMGKKFLKCDRCGKFEWLMKAMAKEEGQIQARIRVRGVGQTNPIMVRMEVPIDELCKDFIGKNNLKN